MGLLLTAAANLNQAYNVALTEMNKLEAGLRCGQSGAACRMVNGTAQKVITLPFLGRTCQLTLPDGVFEFWADDREVPLWVKIILLHYLSRATGAPLRGDLITFRQIPGGDTYFNNFCKRSVHRLVQFFAGKPDLLLAASKVVGGVRVAYGDLAVGIPVLPRVPLTLILWEAVEGFPASFNILFDASVPQYLSTEDIVVLCQELTSMLISTAKGSTCS